MFCTYCQQSRVENQAPCPNCGAPSPLLQVSGIGQWGTNKSTGTLTTAQTDFSANAQSMQSNSWGRPAANFNMGTPWEQASMQPQSPLQHMPPGSQQWDVQTPQLAFDAAPPAQFSPDNSWSQMSPMASNQNMPVWQDVAPGTEMHEGQAASQSLLPMIYQGGANNMRQSTVSLQLIPEHAIEHLLPGLPLPSESVYMPPLYTKPRPLIPRYRVISGFLSVIVVVLLLCTGAGYYAKASGKLDTVLRMFTGTPPKPVTSAPAAKLPDPPNKIDTGPATNIIPSGTTTLRIDKNNIALEIDKIFAVNQPFYVTYSVQPPAGQNGTVSVKWYMNGQLYRVVTSPKVIQGGTTMNGSVQMQYAQAAEGTVEIDWNNQLGERFYFVVR
jgi:hypothetical protein